MSRSPKSSSTSAAAAKPTRRAAFSLLSAPVAATAAVAGCAASPALGASSARTGLSPEFAKLLADYREAHAIGKADEERTELENDTVCERMFATARALAMHPAHGPAEAAELVRISFEGQNADSGVKLNLVALTKGRFDDLAGVDMALLARAIVALGLNPFEYWEPSEISAEVQEQCAAKANSEREDRIKSEWYYGLVAPDGRCISDMRGAEVDALARAMTADDPLLPCGTPTSKATPQQITEARAVWHRLASDVVT